MHTGSEFDCKITGMTVVGVEVIVAVIVAEATAGIVDVLVAVDTAGIVLVVVAVDMAGIVGVIVSVAAEGTTGANSTAVARPLPHPEYNKKIITRNAAEW